MAQQPAAAAEAWVLQEPPGNACRCRDSTAHSQTTPARHSPPDAWASSCRAPSATRLQTPHFAIGTPVAPLRQQRSRGGSSNSASEISMHKEIITTTTKANTTTMMRPCSRPSTSSHGTLPTLPLRDATIQAITRLWHSWSVHDALAIEPMTPPSMQTGPDRPKTRTSNPLSQTIRHGHERRHSLSTTHGGSRKQDIHQGLHGAGRVLRVATTQKQPTVIISLPTSATVAATASIPAT
jgi:hypothetical protein